jgi:hypothetical protein
LENVRGRENEISSPYLFPPPPKKKEGEAFTRLTETNTYPKKLTKHRKNTDNLSKHFNTHCNKIYTNYI